MHHMTAPDLQHFSFHWPFSQFPNLVARHPHPPKVKSALYSFFQDTLVQCKCPSVEQVLFQV